MRHTNFVFALLFLVMIVAAAPAPAAVTTVTLVQRMTPVGSEPAEWQLTNGWSIVTHKRGLGVIKASGPSSCEVPYQPFVAYQLTNAAASGDFPRWSYTLDGSGNPITKMNLGRGAFYASCDAKYGYGGSWGATPSSVWLGTDTHGGRSLAGVKLSQITKMKYFALVSGVPTWIKPGVADAGWDSWKSAWYNPRFPIQMQLTVQGPGGRRQLWYRPWGDHSTIGDQASDGRLSIWEQYDCMSYGRWFCPGDYEPDNPTQFANWAAVLAVYGDYTLVATSTGYDPAAGQWKSPGYTDPTDPNAPTPDQVTDPPGRPACTATGKCLNFWVGARFGKLKRPDTFEYKTWYPESWAFRGQMDGFEFAVNYGTSQAPDIVDTTYNFEPPASDAGPRLVYVSQSNLTDAAMKVIQKRAEPDDPYDPITNPDGYNREEHIYDVLFKLSGKVNDRLNAWFTFDDGAALPLSTKVYTMFQSRWLIPSNPAALDEEFTAWGMLEKFAPQGNPPYVEKPFVVWTATNHYTQIVP